MIARALHLNLDDAWRDQPFGLPIIDAREQGPQLRFSAPPRLIDKFYREFESRLAPFLLYGSGDFHHLSALWLRRVAQPLIVVSFDNHPDWDIRPPKWCCGGWINRALELPHVRHVAFGAAAILSAGGHTTFLEIVARNAPASLEVHPWADDRPMNDRQRRGAILRDNWREHFEGFVGESRGANVYVTIDLDCLAAGEAVTNWENGQFTVGDLEWALAKLRESPDCRRRYLRRVFGTELCPLETAIRIEFDHPKLARPNAQEIQRINLAALERVWPLML